MSIDANARKQGLYSAHDFIRKGEEAEYSETLLSLMEQLTPEGTMEETFATEIMGATWRLRRCRLVEEAFSSVHDLDFDPMVDERTEKQQKSVDRARAQSHLILRRCLAELRKLQGDRHAKLTPEPADAASKDMTMDEFEAMLGLSDAHLRQLARQPAPVEQIPDLPPAASPASSLPASSFCERVPEHPRQTPRNAPCPCGSGAKYKRCCGHDAPPLLNRAA